MPKSGLTCLAVITGLALSSPASAGDEPGPSISERLDQEFRELIDKMRPALDDALEAMRGFDVVDDPRNYMLPEVLPNGDIIIRRRPDAPDLPKADETPPEISPETQDDSIKT